MDQALPRWQHRLQQQGGLDRALASLGVDLIAAEELARLRVQHRSTDLEEQVQLAWCWLSGLGLGISQYPPGSQRSLHAALESLLEQLRHQRVGPVAARLGLDFDLLAEQATTLALSAPGAPVGQGSAAAAEGLLLGHWACRPSVSDPPSLSTARLA